MNPTIRIQAAQLPASSDEDRLVTTSSAIAVLDGATSHYVQQRPSGGDYAGQLGLALEGELESNESKPLGDILEQAIEHTIAALDLRSAATIAPSCTVAIVRIRVTTGMIDALVLGDATVVFGYADGNEEVLTDDRLGNLNLAASDEYRSRLWTGSGYDETHRTLLSSLQQTQARYRNRADGYWIASTDPTAAHHAITVSRPMKRSRWAVAASDGAADSFASAGISWEAVGAADSEQMSNLLRRCHLWEESVDPNGSVRPRSKRHDDKTVVAIRLD